MESSFSDEPKEKEINKDPNHMTSNQSASNFECLTHNSCFHFNSNAGLNNTKDFINISAT